MVKRVFLFLFLSFLFYAPSSFAKDVDCKCPEVTCGPCQKKISIGKEVRFCSWGEINVCRKVICENVNYYFGCISSLKNGKKKSSDKAPLSDVKKDKDFVLPYEEEKKWSKKSKKRNKKKVARKRRSFQRLPEKGEKPQRGISSLRIRELDAKDLTADEIIKRRESDDNSVVLNPAGRIEADNESRVLAGETFSDVIIGKVTQLKGNLQLVHHGESQPLRKGWDLYIGDEILNPEEKQRKLTLLFPKGEVHLRVGPKSRLVVHDPHSLVGRFQPFVHLVYGSLKAKVNMDEGSFDLLSGKVITRLKKGEMKTGYEMVEGELKVHVESLKGQLTVIKASDLASPGIQVKQGHFISWASESAFISPVFTMSKERRKKLGLLVEEKPAIAMKDWTKRKAGRKPASTAQASLCRAPQGQFQQCAWSCDGNPKGAKGCQAQKAGVHCIRRICNAAGQWGQATPFASAYRDLCPAQGTRVGDCQP